MFLPSFTMKKIIFFLVPVLIAVLVFLGILFFLSKKNSEGALQIASDPESKIYLDNELIGTTPFCACDSAKMLPVGEYSLKLAPNDGKLTPFEAKITINKSTLTFVNRAFDNNGGSDGSVITLSSLGDKSDEEVLVISLPDKANVFLDGNPIGTTPLLLKKISAADYDLKVTKDGYKDKSVRIKTALGYKLTATIYLGVNSDLSATGTTSAGIHPIVNSSASVLILDTPTGFLRVRENNSTSSQEIARVKPGESYELVGEKNNWFEIKISSPEARLGWISSQYAIKKQY